MTTPLIQYNTKHIKNDVSNYDIVKHRKHTMNLRVTLCTLHNNNNNNNNNKDRCSQVYLTVKLTKCVTRVLIFYSVAYAIPKFKNTIVENNVSIFLVEKSSNPFT